MFLFQTSSNCCFKLLTQHFSNLRPRHFLRHNEWNTSLRIEKFIFISKTVIH